MLFRRKSMSLAAGLAVVVAGAVAVPAIHAAAEEQDVSVNAWLWNIAGGVDGVDRDAQAQAVADSIIDKEADFVVVNELCGDQYEYLKDKLVDNGWPQGENFARFSKMDTRDTCASDANSNVGFGIFSKQNLSDGSDSTDLVKDPHGPESRKHILNCVTPESSPSLRMCGTHITPTREDDNGEPTDIGDRQIADVQAKVDAYIEDGNAVVMAGDFNTQPHEERLDLLYSEKVGGEVNGNNFGNFRELDDDDAEHCLGYGDFTKENGSGPAECGDGGRKIDLIFASQDHIAGSYAAEVMPIPDSCGGPCSDHHGLTGSVSVAV